MSSRSSLPSYLANPGDRDLEQVLSCHLPNPLRLAEAEVETYWRLLIRWFTGSPEDYRVSDWGQGQNPSHSDNLSWKSAGSDCSSRHAAGPCPSFSHGCSQAPEARAAVLTMKWNLYVILVNRKLSGSVWLEKTGHTSALHLHGKPGIWAGTFYLWEASLTMWATP